MTNSPADEHIIEAIGRCRVVIRNGKVIEVGDARITSCPLTKKFASPLSEITRETVKANIEHRIKAWGMCTSRREVLGSGEFVGFGASEILSFGLHAGLIDAAVMACDGAGTVIVSRPALAQGIGGRMSGLVKTMPYPDVIRRIEEHGGFVLDPDGAALDQPAGVLRAQELGYRRIGVTVALPEDSQKIRSLYPDAIIFGVHVTGLTPPEVEMFADSADLMTSCASKAVRDIIGRKALLQAGVAVPVFALTHRGKEIILEKIRQSDEPVLVKSTKLPVMGEQQPSPLI